MEIEKKSLIVLAQKTSGDYHKHFTCLSNSNEILRLMAFGIRSSMSKLKDLFAPFAYGEASITFNQSKNLYSIQKFDIIQSFDTCMINLKNLYSASLWGEYLLKTYGGEEDTFNLFLACLVALEKSRDEEYTDRIHFQFFIRQLHFSGHSGNWDSCPQCGKTLVEGQGLVLGHEFHCGCLPTGGIFLSSKNLAYLRETQKIELSQALRYKLHDKERENLKKVLFKYIQNIVGFPLKTLVSGRDIL